MDAVVGPFGDPLVPGAGDDVALDEDARGLFVEVDAVAVALHGWDGGVEGAAVARDLQSDAHGLRSAIPYLRSRPHPGGRSIHVSLVVLSRDTVHPEAPRDSVRVHSRADSVVLTYLDGTTVEV
ncbi:hypothetical protein ACFYXM_02675 [Streptomyces sp. NPDC002476]|uniref:hypothetical protein n=1 Tax=Streptomyces sp. NPDC002476 TaxID=3364648 RepID=UPI0036B049C1